MNFWRYAAVNDDNSGKVEKIVGRRGDNRYNHEEI